MLRDSAAVIVAVVVAFEVVRTHPQAILLAMDTAAK